MLEIDQGLTLSDELELEEAIQAARASSVPDNLWRLVTVATPNVPSDVAQKDRELWMRIFGEEPQDELSVTLGLLYAISISTIKDYASSRELYSEFEKKRQALSRSAAALFPPAQLELPGILIGVRRQVSISCWKRLQGICPQEGSEDPVKAYMGQSLKQVRGYIEGYFANPMNVLRFQTMTAVLSPNGQTSTQRPN